MTSTMFSDHPALNDCGNHNTNYLFQTLLARSDKKIYRSQLEYLKNAVSDVGEDVSFYTTNFADVLLKYQLWIEELPDVQMFYAIKANPDPLLLKLLVILGSSFDCATEGEIRAALSAGARPDQIIFANPNVSAAGLRYAKKLGIDLITFDSEEPLNRIHQIYPNTRLLLRICSENVECAFDFSEKYGCKTENASHLLTAAKSLGMDVVGVSFHVGSLNTRTDSFSLAVRNARQVFDVARDLGYEFSILDIGGGFQGSIGTNILFQKIARYIREALSDYFPENKIQVIAEPGCYVICSAVTLTTTISSKRKILDVTSNAELSPVKHHYYLNNGIYSSFAIGIEEYRIYHKPLLTEPELQKRPLITSTLYGHTLCPRDVLQRDVVLPSMNVGESMVWSNMGSYSQSMCSRFCGFQLPESRYIFQRDSRLKTNWIKNLNAVINFLTESTNLINEENLS